MDPQVDFFFTNNANHFEQSKNEAPMFPISYLSKLAGNGAFGSYCEASGGRLVSLAYTPAAICARPQRRIVKTKIEKNFPKIIFVAEQNMKPKIEEKEMSKKEKKTSWKFSILEKKISDPCAQTDKFEDLSYRFFERLYCMLHGYDID